MTDTANAISTENLDNQAETLNQVAEGQHNPINPNLSQDQQNFFCEHYTDFCKMLDIIKDASSNKIVHLIIPIAEAVVKGVASGVC